MSCCTVHNCRCDDDFRVLGSGEIPDLEVIWNVKKHVMLPCYPGFCYCYPGPLAAYFGCYGLCTHPWYGAGFQPAEVKCGKSEGRGVGVGDGLCFFFFLQMNFDRGGANLEGGGRMTVGKR